MPTVTLNKKEFEKLVGKKLPIKELKDRISMLGTDLESIEGNEIHVEIFPNRPDLLSEQGFARAFSSFIGVKTGLREYKVKKSGHKVIVNTSSVKMRPYTACAIIKNMKFTDENIAQIMQIQEKLAKSHGRDRKKSAYGLYPSSIITFPVHYIAKDPAKVKLKPLGIDKELNGLQVEAMHPKGREYKWVADAWRKQGFTKYPFFFDNNKQVLSILPYTNTEDTGKIDENTKEVFIECTGTDLENVKTALNIFCTMLADMDGEVYSMDIVYGKKKITTPDLKPKKMKLDLQFVNKHLGLTLKESQAKKLLNRMGFGYLKGTVLIPAWRNDILHQVDLAEDIAIAYGYENFEPIIPEVSTIGKEIPLEAFKDRIRDILVGQGLIETTTYNLTNEKEHADNVLLKEKFVRVANPVTEEFNIMRKRIFPSVLKTLKINKRHEYPQEIFELGRTFFIGGKNETGTFEEENLCAALCGENAGFTRIKQIADYLFNHIDSSYDIKAIEHPSFIKGRIGELSIKGKKIGFLGEIHPQVLDNFELEMPVALFEVNISRLFDLF